ncbi:substrate-binding domain-containing protein [Desertibacillus haloalkaliphilus]|uniref:substrate-binding domain-containing protein n=1 Tax=Desertibacillus haloalkaliphilus TaxID=1328930 RepID=UPI001C27A81C|nr:substrate-binding domain-containing protein [Desertibacillus haloalkaliphilus]MBU8906031.1 substrate-binding domain-containing protein [Desertibacillus haloalkaliphilus]
MRPIVITLLTLITLISTGCTNQTSESASEIILATTTSTEDSGLLDKLIPMFEEEHNINVKTIAVGTGQALAMGEKGEADVLLTHAPEAEEELVESEDVINRKRVMYNDFIIIGPQEDPANIHGETLGDAMEKIYETSSAFTSRGDDSGTHKKELTLWESANRSPFNESWYDETGQGMGSTLQVGVEREAYLLTDRATYLAHKENFDDIVIHVEGDERLFNIYHVMQVNDEKHSHVNGTEAQLFVEFMVSTPVQAVVEEFGIDLYGQSLFIPYTE